jgi:hypothetical protein
MAKGRRALSLVQLITYAPRKKKEIDCRKAKKLSGPPKAKRKKEKKPKKRKEKANWNQISQTLRSWVKLQAVSNIERGQ